VQFGSAALTKSDGSSGVVGIGTDIFKIFTAGANGSFVEKIRLSPVAIVAATATSATVHRIYVSSVTTGVTANTNTFLIAEVQASAQTADQTVTATFYYEIPLNIKLNANWTILVSTHIVNAANTNWTAVAFGMDF
jgi:purine-nucleoside phosphorylase